MDRVWSMIVPAPEVATFPLYVSQIVLKVMAYGCLEIRCIIYCNSKNSSAVGFCTAQGNFSLGAEYINCKMTFSSLSF